ncbi:hypothetical protein SDC9_86721 [bioreactor metagenome]|uniref:IPTL-CTERM protein sorting domain-containing protein n=1 Tax=bioreactor metagenome TaxID=1076179 RepID=A0A644ZN09_9ZZZZ
MTATGPAPGEAVQFASRTEGVCTTTGAHGATVTLRTVGTCTLRATQADAPAVERSFQVSMPATTGTTLPGPDGGQGTVSGGGWQFAANSAGSASSGALPPLPAGYRFVQSNGFGFVLAGGTVDGVARVTWQWTQPAPANAMLWKHGPTGANATPHWHDVQGQFDAPRTSASFSITDGGDGDEDGLRNGVIVDPVFLVAPANVAPTNTASVPTLSDAGRAMLALALAAMAAVGQSRRNR